MKFPVLLRSAELPRCASEEGVRFPPPASNARSALTSQSRLIGRSERRAQLRQLRSRTVSVDPPSHEYEAPGTRMETCAPLRAAVSECSAGNQRETKLPQRYRAGSRWLRVKKRTCSALGQRRRPVETPRHAEQRKKAVWVSGIKATVSMATGGVKSRTPDQRHLDC